MALSVEVAMIGNACVTVNRMGRCSASLPQSHGNPKMPQSSDFESISECSKTNYRSKWSYRLSWKSRICASDGMRLSMLFFEKLNEKSDWHTSLKVSSRCSYDISHLHQQMLLRTSSEYWLRTESKITKKILYGRLRQIDPPSWQNKTFGASLTLYSN